MVVTAFASAQASPTASTATVLQRLGRTADILAAAAAAQGEVEAPADADAEGSPLGDEQDSATAGGAQAQHQQPEQQQPEGWLARGCRSPSTLIGGLFGRGPASPSRAQASPARGPPSPGKVAEGSGSAASSPIRQLLNAPAALLGAMGWGAGRAQEVEKAGAQEAAAEQQPSLGQQQSLPSNPFDMLPADDSAGGASCLSPCRPAVGEGEVQSAATTPASVRQRRGLMLPLAAIPGEAAAGLEPQQSSPPLRPRRQLLQRHLQSGGDGGADVDALRASVASSRGGGGGGEEGWEGAASISTPTRLAVSKDNPLFEPFGSSFAPPAAASPDRVPQGLPAAHLLGTAVFAAGVEVVQLSPAAQQQLCEAGQPPGSAGSFALGRGTPLEPVLEQVSTLLGDALFSGTALLSSLIGRQLCCKAQCILLALCS